MLPLGVLVVITNNLWSSIWWKGNQGWLETYTILLNLWKTRYDYINTEIGIYLECCNCIISWLNVNTNIFIKKYFSSRNIKRNQGHILFSNCFFKPSNHTAHEAVQNRGQLLREWKLKIINFPNGLGEMTPLVLIPLALSKVSAFNVDVTSIFIYVDWLEYYEKVHTARTFTEWKSAEKGNAYKGNWDRFCEKNDE